MAACKISRAEEKFSSKVFQLLFSHSTYSCSQPTPSIFFSGALEFKHSQSLFLSGQWLSKAPSHGERHERALRLQPQFETLRLQPHLFSLLLKHPRSGLTLGSRQQQDPKQWGHTDAHTDHACICVWAIIIKSVPVDLSEHLSLSVCVFPVFMCTDVRDLICGDWWLSRQSLTLSLKRVNTHTSSSGETSVRVLSFASKCVCRYMQQKCLWVSLLWL